MAYTPTKQEVKTLLAKSKAEDAKKAKSQAKQGKEFKNNGQGVIPESVWKNLPGKQNG